MSDITYTLIFKNKDGEVLHSADVPSHNLEKDIPGTLAAHYIMDNRKAVEKGEEPNFPPDLENSFATIVRKRPDKEAAEEYDYSDVVGRIKALYGSSSRSPEPPGPEPL